NQQGGLLHLSRFKALVSGNAPVLEANSTAPIRYDLKKGELLPPEALETGRLVHVTLHGLPLSWVRPFVAAAEISGGQVTGEIDVMRAAGSVTAASVKGKIQVSDLTVVQDGRPLLAKAAVTALAEATLAGGTVDAPAIDVGVTTPGGDSLSVNGHLKAAAGA